jgi:hypothetical protein
MGLSSFVQQWYGSQGGAGAIKTGWKFTTFEAPKLVMEWINGL